VRARLALAASVCALATWGCAGLGLGSIEGEVRIGSARASAARLGPVVVYLERENQPEPAAEGTLTLLDSGGDGVRHDLVVVRRGEALRFASQTGVAHRLFAIRGQERIDVTVSENEQSRRVSMDRVGWVRFYCSLHQDESWDVFVAPSAHYARVDAAGSYRIPNLPPGEYRLFIWSEAYDGAVRQVRVGLVGTRQEPIVLDPAKIDS
jgi:hypothetical protein